MMQVAETRVLVTVQLVDDTTDLMAFLFFVTTLFALLASVSRLVAYLNGWLADITAAIIFTAKVASITLNSLAYGLGV